MGICPGAGGQKAGICPKQKRQNRAFALGGPEQKPGNCPKRGPARQGFALVALSKNRVLALGGAKSAAKCALLKRNPKSEAKSNAKRTRATTPGIGIFGCAYFPGDSWASSSARFHAAFAAGV